MLNPKPEIARIVFLLWIVPSIAWAQYEVTNTNDSGAGSLRQAITNANGSTGETITFNIPNTDPNYVNSSGDERWIISPVTQLPDIAQSMVIDATTQPGNGNYRIQLDGQSTINNGIYVRSSPVTVYGFYITGFTVAGVHTFVAGTGGLIVGDIGKGNVINDCGTGIRSANAHNHVIKGNIIGTDETGTTAIPNGNGIFMGSGAGSVIVGGSLAGEENLISGNSGGGIVTNSANSWQIIGNLIGTDINGTSPIPNDYGIQFQTDGNHTVTDNTISGNLTAGISFLNSSTSTIRGNRIGVDVNGTNAMGNGIGIYGQSVNNADNNIIGGTGGGEGNIIAYNTNQGVYFENANHDFNQIIGNSIFCNGGKGIDLNSGLGNDGKTAPVVTGVISTDVTGTGTDGDIIHVYRDNLGCSPKQGYEYLGSTTVSLGTWTLGGLSLKTDLDHITATATDGNGNTSEFSTQISPTSFITTWQTDNFGTSNDNQITIPTTGSGYDYNISWEEVGNSSNSGTEPANQTGNYTITFPSAGTYRVAITGTFPRIYFAGAGDVQKILTVEQWGDNAWTSMEGAFQGTNNLTLTATDAPDLSGVTNLTNMFLGCSSLTGDLNNWDVSNITSMFGMFWGASSFNSDLNNWTPTLVTDMSRMFQSALSFNGNIDGWNTPNLTSTFEMFYQAYAFNQDLNNWTFGVLDNMSGMFREAITFNGNISNWDVSTVTNMSNLFSSAIAFNQNIGAWAVDEVLTLAGTFAGAQAFNQDLSSWVTSKVTNMQQTFIGATSFNGDVTTWDVASVTNMLGMFQGATSFNQPIGLWGTNTSLVSLMTSMFLGATSFNQDLSGWDVSSVLQMDGMFSGASAFNGDVTTWNTSNVTTMTEMFRDATSFNQDIGTWDVSKVTTTFRMFQGATSFNQDLLYVPGGGNGGGDAWNLAMMNTTAYMFNGATSFDGNISNWNMSAVTDISGMFAGTPFNQNISSWNVANVTVMGDVFSQAVNFNQDISGWDVSKVTWMRGMFFGASSFNQPIGTWGTKTGLVTDMLSMFGFATSFNQDLRKWDVSTVGDMRWMFENATAFNQNLGDWQIDGAGMLGMFNSATGMSTANYDSTLIGWESQAPTANTFSAPNFTYCVSETQRQSLIDNYGWNIIDAGQDCPVPPTNLFAEEISATQINLTWTDNSSDETGFEITRSSDYAGTLNVTTFNVAADVVAYDDVSVTAGDGYFYTVRAIRDGTPSDDSNVKFASSLAYPGHALDFDGSDDYISFAQNPLGVGYTGSLSVEALVFPTDLSSLQSTYSGGIVRNANNDAIGDFFLGVTSDGYVVFTYWDQAGDDPDGIHYSTNSILEYNWTHIAATYDGANVKIYINGVEETLTTWNTATGWGSGFDIGRSWSGGGGYYWIGEIDEVRIWDDVRTQLELQSSMANRLVGNEANLVGYYSFDQGIPNGDNTTPAVDVLPDRSTNDFNGTLLNFDLNNEISNWVTPGVPPMTYYVDANASGGNNGTSWTDAFVDLQSALSLAGRNDTIVVADGTYYPSIQINPEGLGMRESFQIPSGVLMFGGFAGGEDIGLISSFANRDFETNRTILSGDLNKDSSPPTINTSVSPMTITFNNTSDNAYHVLYGEDLEAGTTVDGFTIQHGYNNGDGAGFTMEATSEFSEIIFENCTFRWNRANRGPAIGKYDQNIDAPNFFFRLVNCLVTENEGVANGAIFLEAETVASVTNMSLDVFNSKFVNNVAGEGAALALVLGFNTNNFLRLHNNLFYGNDATGSYGAIAVYHTDGLFIVNNIIADNYSSSATGSGMMLWIEPIRPSTVRNNIIWNNESSSGDFTKQIEVQSGNMNIDFSLVQNGASGIYENGGTSNYSSGTNFSGDPLFTDPVNGNYTVQPGSPAIDAGNNSYILTSDPYDIDYDGNISESWPYDLAGNNRIQSNVDLGAYELQLIGGVIACDYNALIALFNSTDGANWTNNTNWLSGDISTWFGVSVTGDRVSQIIMPLNNLIGTIPQEISCLDALTNLDLEDNFLSGNIPIEIGNLTSLTNLNLDGNLLTGSIPTTIGNLVNLTGLDLDGNQLSGSIPIEIGNLTSLSYIGFSDNQLSGSIPAEIGNLTILNELWIDNNQLTGSLPIELGNLAALTGLWLSDNQISGIIPAELGNISNLIELQLQRNQLTGTIPVELTNLSNLTTLRLNQNLLTGTIPITIDNLSVLQRLELNNNQLSGNIPIEIGNVSTLTRLELQQNLFSGSIPIELGNLINLGTLDLSNNQLSGPIPLELGNLTSLVDRLQLSNNLLNGSLPVELGNLINLTQFKVANNQLSGVVPSSFSSLANLIEYEINGNSFIDQPDFSSLSGLINFRVEDNFFHFDDIEPNVGITGITYSPQGLVTGPGNQDVNSGDPLNLTITLGGSANQYQWVKDGIDLAGETSNSLSIANATLADAGTYYLRITSSLVSGLTLQSEDIVITVNAAGPEINLFQGTDNTGTVIIDGQAGVIDFGTATVGNDIDVTFAIENSGDTDLNISSVNISSTDFSLVGAAPTVVTVGSIEIFTVRLSGATSGSFTATVTINNDDADESAFVFSVSGIINDNCTTLIVDVGADVLVCPGGVVDLAPSITGSATAFNWSSSGDGSFGNSTVAVTQYNLGSLDESFGTVTLTLTASSATCPSQSDQVIIDINLPIQADNHFDTVDIGSSIQIDLSSNVTANASDILTYSINQNPQKGNASVSSNFLNYSPNQGTVGSDSVVYQVCNQCDLCDTKTVFITIPNVPPTINHQSTATGAGETLTLDLTQSIGDINDNLDPGSLTVVIPPESGANAYFDSEGNLIVDYTGVVFTGPDQLTIRVCDFSGECAEAIIIIQVDGERISVINAVSPNGDGAHDYLKILNIEFWPNNEVKIYNRWGDKVFEMKGYQNNIFEKRFNGDGNASSKGELSDGTYYYSIDRGNGSRAITGFFVLRR